MGDSAAFLSAGGYHHHIGLNTWESRGGPRATAGHDRPLSLRDPLSRSRDARRRAAPARQGRAFLSTARATTASARRSICATPTATASSSIGTGRARSGRATPTARCRWSTERLESDPPARRGSAPRRQLPGAGRPPGADDRGRADQAHRSARQAPPSAQGAARRRPRGLRAGSRPRRRRSGTCCSS